MDENLKHLSKPAKKLLLLLRTKYHASTGIDTAWLAFPKIEQAMGIDSDAVRALTNELKKYDYVVYRDQAQVSGPEVLRITKEGLSAAEQLVLWNRITRILRPVWSHTITFVLGLAVAAASWWFISNYLETTESNASDSDNANSQEAAPE